LYARSTASAGTCATADAGGRQAIQNAVKMGNIRVTVDAVVIENNEILLIKRGIEPFKGKWALPGGHVDYGETVEDAVIREAKEETGLDIVPQMLIGVYSDPERDPRGHAVGMAFLCKAKKGQAKAGDDAAETWWFPLDDLPELAFDHAKMVKDAKKLLN